MIAFGPIFGEQETMMEHTPLRDKTAALERALADELRRRGYKILGVHPRAAQVDNCLLEQLMTGIRDTFPMVPSS